MWKLRKGFWNGLATRKFASNKPAMIPVPRDDGRKLKAVSFASQFPGIPIPNILVADHVPDDEAQPLKVAFYKFQVGMYSVFPATQPGLPPISADPQKAFDEAYTDAHRRLFPPPVLPEEYKNNIDLGRISVASPYACYVEKAPEGGYQWNLSQLDGYEYHAGLRPIGCRVLFRVNEGERRLEATQIDCDLGTCRPGDPDWEFAQKIALCAATTHVSLVRHFNGIHLAVGGPFAIATRNQLPAAHPLRRLLWPHMYGTQYSNQIVTKGQMAKGGDFETTFSFTHRGMCKLFEETYEQYDFIVLDPERDAERRGIKDAGFDTPVLSNRRAIFDVMHAHALRYLRLYYETDEKLREDANVQGWVEELDRLIPNGVRKVLGNETTIEGAGRLIAALIYLAAVEHEALGTGLWNYQLWTHVQPIRVYRNGQREPQDVYQRLVNANFNLNVSRTRLMHDFGYMALDRKGADAFRIFRFELETLQKKMEQEPPACWKIYPNILEANINA
ncbi:MAG TPA: lipoxygenase family protein [Pyrinomonadaceae bacterium]|nr:lipoxygenase family protein [Pyrinomonadaceae bacterium]